jgi:hypothetical protein
MSARDAIITEIKLARESLVQEAYDFVLFLKSRRSSEQDTAAGQHTPSVRPDFLARQQALFGNRVVPDSQVIMDELRAERF